MRAGPFEGFNFLATSFAISPNSPAVVRAWTRKASGMNVFLFLIAFETHRGSPRSPLSRGPQPASVLILPSKGKGKGKMKKIYLDKRVWRNSTDNWVSFESDPKLRVTKTNICGRCVPCITSLYQQLQEGKEEVELKEAYHCWKVMAVLKDKEECLGVLREYGENFLGDHDVKGKFGPSLPTKPTKVLMFHIEDEEERDRILKELQACVEKVSPETRVFYQRACTNLYYDLLDDWKDWKKVTRTKIQMSAPCCWKGSRNSFIGKRRRINKPCLSRISPSLKPAF